MLSPRDADSAAAASPRHLFGAMVRYYRTQAGLSRDQLGARVYLTGDMVGRIETGQRTPSGQFIDACEAVPELNTFGALRALREQLKDQLKSGPYPGWFENWPQYEATARTLRTWQLVAVPGLLQTEDYARAMLQTQVMTTADEIEEMVAARMERQAILTRDKPPMLWVILDEDVLRRPVGGRWVMKDQLRHLAEAARRPNVVLQVIPLAAGAHQGMSGSFVLAEFENSAPVVYQDTATRGQIIEDANDIEGVSLLWDTLIAEALPRSASLELVEEVAKTWT
jgi:transcriptional regulator with XRE-family HTH domain